MKTLTTTFLTLLLVTMLFAPATVHALDLEPTMFDTERLQLRYAYATRMLAIEDDATEPVLVPDHQSTMTKTTLSRKSPAKAFLLSAAVPGLGQWYYGSRVKPFLFLGAEVASWMMYTKYHGEGNDATDAYEAFSQLHWHETDYEQYLEWTYGETDDDLINATEVSHHLPDTHTQQYYEMTGKYNQFAWGWDDAALPSGQTLESFSMVDPPPPIVAAPSTIPMSDNRDAYEGMRHDANNKYSRANKMVVVSIVNHLVSAFEAYFVTKHHNAGRSQQNSEFSRVKVRAELLSYYTAQDTPMLKLGYRF